MTRFYSIFRKDRPRVRIKSEEKVTEKVTERVTENQLEILKSIKNNPSITTKELSGIVGISDRKIKENIKKLKGNGFLQRIGPAKGGYWKVKEKKWQQKKKKIKRG